MQRQKEHTLVVTDGPNVGQRYQLREGVSTVGRTAGNAIVLDSVQISRHHAQIQLTPTGATIEDIGSTNGTWVNDQRLVGSHALTSGDRIRFADFVTMEYVVKESSGTEVLPSPMAGGATEGTGQAFDFDVAAPPMPAYAAPEVDPYVPPYPAQPAYAAPQIPVAQQAGPAASPSRRPQGLYIVIGVLVVLICLCVALGIYLWFAPLSFWEWLFDLLGIPWPTSSIVTMIPAWL